MGRRNFIMEDNNGVKEDASKSTIYNNAENIKVPAQASTASVNITGVNQIDSLLSGYKWGSNNVTFSFPTTKSQYSGYLYNEEPNKNFIALNTMQQNAARSALAKWASVCNLTFTETTGGNGTILFGTSSLPSTSWAYYPTTNAWGGDVWFGNSTSDSPNNPVVGNYDYATYIHEIGHALGLKHPHDTGGSAKVANANIDSMEYSIMSYRSYVGADVSGGYTNDYNSFATGPMISDIAAIQYMYGANYTFNSGDTVYKFDPNEDKIFETIWDGGGNDTYDLSSYNTNLTIDLSPGGWSIFDTSQLAYLGDGHYARGSVANALLYNGNIQSLIENAIGGSGNDRLLGNQADNFLDGGTGADYMAGGIGNDSYVVDNILDVVVENAGGGTDIVQSSITYTLSTNVENLILTGAANINGTGNTLNNYIIGNSGSNILTGGAGNDTLDGGSGSDQLIGGVGNDTYVVDNIGDVVVEKVNEGTDTVQSSITYTLSANVENLILTGIDDIDGIGNALNNVITGNNGNNNLDGGLGADRLAGGAGDDTYIVDNIGDVVLESENEGSDTVLSSISYTLPANVEKLILTGTSNINGTGNTLDNTITGNSGNNILNGGLGADTMAGGLGNDTFVVDNASDVVIENAGEGIDTVQSSITYTLGSNVENLTLTGNSNINGSGNELNNVITGNSGNNILDGGLGADLLVGGAGNDIYVVDDALDVVVENANGGTDTVQSSISYTLTANVENLILTDTGNIDGIGNALNNVIIGNSGNNILTGGAGNDTLTGGAGDDVLNGGAGADTYVFGIGSGNDIIARDAYNSLDTIKIEVNDDYDRTFTRSGNDLILTILYYDSWESKNILDTSILTLQGWYENIGSKVTRFMLGDQTLVINDYLSGNGTINGASLNDYIEGGDGSDVINGNAGNDYLIGGKGNDIIYGGAGDDNIGGDAGLGDNGGDDKLYGGAGNDQLWDRYGSNLLDGGDGNDDLIIDGDGNNDPTNINILLGGNGNDTLHVWGGSTNTLDGGAGNDILENYGRNSTLIGGAGNDLYILATGTIQNTVNDAVGIDKVQIVGMDGSAVNASDYTYQIENNSLIMTSKNDPNVQIIFSDWMNHPVTTVQFGNTLMNWQEFTMQAGAVWKTFGSTNDTFLGTDEIDVVNGGAGNDILSGGSGDDVLIGGDGNDILSGGIGNDMLNGGAGNDTLDGGLGGDWLVGGVGNDTYIVDNVLDVVVENLNEGTDTVQSSITYTLAANLENLTLTGTDNISGTGNTLNNIITGNNGNNVLDGGLGADRMVGGLGDDTYVVDNVSDVVVEIADQGIDTVQSSITYTLGVNVENLTLTGTGSINGTGNALDNVIIGNSGNNILNGGAGADQMEGGVGNDIYVVDNVGDVVVENIEEGIDTVQSSITYALGSNVENLTLTGTDNIDGIGNSLNNVIIGNSSKNTLVGGAGDDVLNGGLGADILLGGVGNDTYIVDNIGDVVEESIGEGTDTVQSSITYELGSNVENLTLTGTGSINGTGNELNNVIIGNSGKNILTGGAGDDILDGGLGADRLIGGLGDDTYMVDNAGDVVVENGNEGIDTVQSSITYTLGDNVENLTLMGIGNINGTGNTINNIIIGNAGNNILNGGLGADVMKGGAGNDTYVVDNVGDSVVENSNEGIDTVQSSISFSLGSNIENLILTGTSNINGIGNELNNTITGNSGNNILNGGLGADIMKGGAGSDTYVVDDIGDVVVENAGAGTDTVQSSISYTLTSNVENLTLTGTSDINGTGNALNNIIIGNNGNNVLNGGVGADWMMGGRGDDTYVVDNVGDFVFENLDEGTDTVQSTIEYMLGSNIENLTLIGTSNINGTGNELDNVITGNSGNNILDGGDGNDWLYGGAGNDTLYGGAGDDVLEGGLGNDTYIFGLGDGNDTINSYVGNNIDNGLDTLKFQDIVLSGVGFTKDSNDLICTINQTGDTIRLSNWLLGANYQVDQFQFADSILTAKQITQKIV